MGSWGRFARRGAGGAASGGRASGGVGVGAGGGAGGGWRAVAPLAPTIAGAAAGVSDGLRFRSRLASWRDPSLCGELGHAVLGSAPVGILRAVARPLGPATSAGGGEPVMSYAAPPAPVPAAALEHDGPVTQVQRSGAVRRRLPATSATGVVPDVGAAPTAGKARPRRSGLVRPRPVGESLIMAPRPWSSPTRTVAVIPPLPLPPRPPRRVERPDATSTGAAATQRSADAGQPGVVAGAEATAGAGPAETPAPIAAQRTVGDSGPTAGGVVQRAGVEGAASGRPVLGAPLAALPASASPQLAADGRRPGRARADDVSGPALAPMPIVPAPSPAPAPSPLVPQAVGSAEILPGGPGAGPSAAAPQPTLQRHADSAPARTRGGLGAPLNALPPTAGVPGGTAALLGRRGGAVPRVTDTAASGGTQDGSGSAREHGAPTSLALPQPPAPPQPPARTGMVLRSKGAPREAAAPDAPHTPGRTGTSDSTAVQRAVDGGSGSARRDGAALTVPVRSPVPGGGIVRRTTEPVHRARGLLGARRTALALAASAPVPATGTDRAAAPATPVVRPAWRQVPPASTDSRSATDSAVSGSWRRRATAVLRLPWRGEARRPDASRSERPANPVESVFPGGAGQDVRPSRLGATRARRPSVQRSTSGGPRPTTPDAQPELLASALRPAATPLPRGRRADRTVPPVVATPDAVRHRGTASTSASRGGPGPSVPLVRLARPGTAAAPAPVQRLPVGLRAAQPFQVQPPSGGSWPARTAEGDVVTPGALATPGTPGTPAAPGTDRLTTLRPPAAPTTSPSPPSPSQSSAGTARVLQRVAEQAGLSGVPLTAVPPRTPAAAPPLTAAASHAEASTRSPTETAATAETTAGADIDELARRLIEPVGRLLRAELRRGRERAGRPYDGRR
ncbi:hypothetical protein P3T36_003877 [Kitasatospora sp. MAP12-15]|nr:hypothetical protein [Kitasatospora sp. MAP12-44]